ncbi:MAG: N-acetyl-gamma-glutamyl-phosphate reductase [Thermoanaerobaculia bacterium]
MSGKIPVVVAGGSGYVAGELLRLLVAHPGFEVVAVLSDGHVGDSIEGTFPHLAGCVGTQRFSALDSLANALHDRPRAALVSAAPHGVSAGLIARALEVADATGTELSVVDLSADFRFADADAYRMVYGHEPAAPGLLPQFLRALPEHSSAGGNLRYVAHPGCFTTAVLLAIVPLLARGLVLPRFAVSAITGSTGSGRGLSEKTHHPARRSNVAAYSPLAHRHAPEMVAFAQEASGVTAEIDFVPLSGPQARGIYAVVHGRLTEKAAPSSLQHALTQAYAGAPFVRVAAEPPALTSVVGTNRAHLGVAAGDHSFAITVAIDNLIKGAAGGGIQWLNRIYGFDETAGLMAGGLGWY